MTIEHKQIKCIKCPNFITKDSVKEGYLHCRKHINYCRECKKYGLTVKVDPDEFLNHLCAYCNGY